MFHQLLVYGRFLWDSKNEHGVHSPFVFSFATKCMYDGTKHAGYHTISKYNERLLSNKSHIKVCDFGAGSRIFRSDNRQICKIARHAGMNPKRQQLLYRILLYLKPRSVLELGTSLGMATCPLALADPSVKVVSVEGCTETLKVAEQTLQHFGIHNVTLVNASFETFLEDYAASANPIDLIYFDGNHSQTATENYFNQLLPTATNDSVWIFDDIHWSAGMEKAWQYIKDHPRVTVTIDTFQWGIVFFRREQEKEHFTLRC